LSYSSFCPVTTKSIFLAHLPSSEFVAQILASPSNLVALCQWQHNVLANLQFAQPAPETEFVDAVMNVTGKHWWNFITHLNKHHPQAGQYFSLHMNELALP